MGIVLQFADRGLHRVDRIAAVAQHRAAGFQCVGQGGADIRPFRYNDKHPWPESPDGLGYALALMVDLLAMLSGNGAGALAEPSDGTWSQGQWFAALRIDLFQERHEFEADVRRLVERLHGSAGPDGPVHVFTR